MTADLDDHRPYLALRAVVSAVGHYLRDGVRYLDGVEDELVAFLETRAFTGVDQGISTLRTLTWQLLRSPDGPGGPAEKVGSGTRAVGEAAEAVAALHSAVADADSALDGDGGPSGSPVTAAVLRAVHRARDRGAGAAEERATAVQAGLAALREEAAAAVLSAAADALPSARRTAELAYALAADCLAEEDAETALAAVEFARNLLLTAATTTTDVPGLLRAARRPDLAEEWLVRAGPSAALDDLRRRVVATVTETGTGRDVLRPTGPDEIGRTLRDGDRAALVYLLAGDRERPGWALSVTAEGTLHAVELRGLRLTGDGPLDRWLGARPTADGLAEACAWAGAAVFEPLLARLPVPEPAVVLVCCGLLGTVPWHAALIGAGERPARACERAVVSYAASARQFAEVTARPRRLPNPARGARCGGGTTRPLDRADAARHLPGGTGVVAPVLHVDCAAVVADPPGASYLEWSNRSRLTMAQMLAAAVGTPPAGGVVLLSACRSDVSTPAHDDCLGIGAALVTAGTGPVIATRWPPPGPIDEFVEILQEQLLRRPAPVALAVAQRAVRTTDPLVWAAFYCHG